MDFRQDAVDASQEIINKNSLTPWTEIDESLCLEASANSAQIQACFEIPLIMISVFSMLFAFIAPVLGISGLVPFPIAIILMGFSLSILLMMRKVKSWLFSAYLRGREGSLRPEFPELPSRFIGLENGATINDIKLIIEDQGICIFDKENKRIFIDGSGYRYLIRGKDIISIKPRSAYAMSGANIRCKIAGQELAFVLTVAGHGPIASLIESFYPPLGAKGLAGFLIYTLFDKTATEYVKEG